jgi:hypothetical protein
MTACITSKQSRPAPTLPGDRSKAALPCFRRSGARAALAGVLLIIGVIVAGRSGDLGVLACALVIEITGRSLAK